MTPQPCDTPIDVADPATLLLWQSGMAAMTHGGTP